MLRILRTIWSDFKKELPKTLIGISVSGLGFLLALGIDHWSEQQKDMETYRSMLTAIRSEAAANRATLDTSYATYFSDGLVVQEFSYSTVTQMFASPLFMKYAKPEDVVLLNTYVRTLALANGYRRVAETLNIQQPRGYDSWMPGLNKVWGQKLPELSKEIDEVAKIKE
jgi:hypothetical protein